MKITDIETIRLAMPSRGLNSALSRWPHLAARGPGLGVTLDFDKLAQFRRV